MPSLRLRMTQWNALSGAKVVELALRLRSLECTWEIGATPSARRSSACPRRVPVIRPQWELLDTGLERDARAAALWAREQEEELVERVQLRLTDYDFSDEWDRTHDTFVRMATALCAALGDPTARRPGSPAEIHWDDTDTKLLLEHTGSSVYLERVTHHRLDLDEEVRRMDEIEEEEEGLL
ncbi:hypothetical protein GCM10010329_30020 [Streptomyces spiroverticillatus]|uniref:Uncharacterized protein n=1 Tax=Streptomyces finlayi TaxID=67296 RepID=A0A918WW75_9ACTN|nr:hypothetical protein GCM10010329_30020 [Streptomyces spiroverticillatus]GHC89406.1 hypothetical protein GCM10010334_22430 [Streptomyces finlayi]